jgi:hypothetical protein
MDMPPQNPDQASPSYAEPRRKPSATLRRIVGELGLRYRPASAAEIQAHEDKLELLVEDLNGIAEDVLETAAKELAKEKPFMPRASDLIERCKAIRARRPDSAKRANLDQMNAKLRDDNQLAHDGGVRWYRDAADSLKLGHPPGNRGSRCTADQARQILREEGVRSPFLLELLASIERAESSKPA